MGNFLSDSCRDFLYLNPSKENDGYSRLKKYLAMWF